jgi:hypothetical protein
MTTPSDNFTRYEDLHPERPPPVRKRSVSTPLGGPIIFTGTTHRDLPRDSR